MAASADPIKPRRSLAAAAGVTNGGALVSDSTPSANGAMLSEPLPPRSASCEADNPTARGRSQSPALPGRRGDEGAGSRGSGSESHSAKRRSGSGTVTKALSNDNVARLSAAEVRRLTSAPESLPVAPAPQRHPIAYDLVSRTPEQLQAIRHRLLQPHHKQHSVNPRADDFGATGSWPIDDPGYRPQSPRTVSTPPTPRVPAVDDLNGASALRRFSFGPAARRPPPLDIGSNEFANGLASSPAVQTANAQQQQSPAAPGSPGPRLPSPAPSMIPLPPMSLPTHLQLELAAQRPSPLYIHHSYTDDMPYESNAVKLERLKNVLLLAPYLERTLYFGALACLDAWLHTFTILPIRFILALAVLVKWWGYVIGKEAEWLVGFVWPSDASDRERSRSRMSGAESSTDAGPTYSFRLRGRQRAESHVDSTDEERTKSLPSSLSAFHKADLLQGAVIICSSLALMTLDASRMYHFVRAQSAIKLYVIFNILEVGDRLLSALGQDILECLFSAETLSRNSSGRSKIFLPLTMFLLALVYNCLHSIALYYQVITLNVAVNSYSNALLTLLLSNQFVEIKSTVFKRFERDSLFQLTCADIVERFQLWVMLLIIGMRNVVEVGGLSVPGAGVDSAYEDGSGPGPLHPPSILPHSFTVLPSWLMSGEVLSPFLIVVGSEMLVDTIKHAYVTKFNNIKPAFYSRTLDILCKDYYANAFTTPALTRRLGLAVIPLSCLFIRASVQTYHMFLSTKIPMPMPQSTQTSLSEESATPSSPAMIAALSRFDALIRDSLGRATYGYPYGSPLNSRPWYSWTSDDLIAALTMVVVFFMAFLVLLIVKLILGMVLLQYARNRYAKMKQKDSMIALGQAERETYETRGRRVGCRPEVEIGEDRQRWINADASEGLPGAKRAGEDNKKIKTSGDYQGVFRYEMVAKRIW
ncbi:eukaryotic membrane protein [Hirsutella rhossiliensis]|uniref:Eukaryotic membrane protein n=1 Tax=Hirsutella rhossiliensis TaxID=111463 RepID=A0A9P8MM33_9HYPO|nr:eukaryotic membrane protein [Hirsutella rhossiliensis]KAH0957570.1 eukaryotic membrane protein [Hirsutella rhossiliensis]